jgi:hypothetical protein
MARQRVDGQEAAMSAFDEYRRQRTVLLDDPQARRCYRRRARQRRGERRNASCPPGGS